MITPAQLAAGGTEHGHQCAVFCWSALTRAQYPMLEWMYAVPNGGARSASQGSILKAEGVKSGVADICLPYPASGYHGLYIEMKCADGLPSDVSEKQSSFLGYVNAVGYLGIVCFGWEQAVEAIQRYLHSYAVA